MRQNYDNLLPLKADFLAERSVKDNIVEETDQNSFVIGLSYVLMFLYVGIALGHVPSRVHSKFSLGLIGIIVVICALMSSFGLTFYFN